MRSLEDIITMIGPENGKRLYGFLHEKIGKQTEQQQSTSQPVVISLL